MKVALQPAMRLETIPLIIGGLIGLVGLLLVLDAWLPDNVVVSPERRRRARRERDRAGEAMVGLGVLAMAGAWIGRDTWRYSVIAVIVGAILLLVGALKSRSYLRAAFWGASHRK